MNADNLSTLDDLRTFVGAFEDCTLPKSAWTHHAHLVVGLWTAMHNTDEEALALLRRHIQRYNEATGTPNNGTSGYHETLTGCFAAGIRAFVMQRKATEITVPLLDELLRSELGDKRWPLKFYSRERLASLEARIHWMEPDLRAITTDA